MPYTIRNPLHAPRPTLMDGMNYLTAQAAQHDFEAARRKAFLTAVGALLRHQPNELLAFDEFERLLPMEGQVYRGIQAVPVAAVRGSVDRYHDFDRNFLPAQSHTRPRWIGIDKAMITDTPLPPIAVYKLGEVYFVKDGNHRVSVARERGMDYIDADVIEISTPVPIPADVDGADLLLLAEYGRFLQQTDLDTLRPAVCIAFTALGRYDTLLEHISAHRWYLGINLKRAISWTEAVQSWYDTLYAPMIATIREQGILADFPRRTEADLYLWIMDHGWHLSQETGQVMDAPTAAHSYDVQYARGGWGRRVARWLGRLLRPATGPFVVSGQLVARAVASLRDPPMPPLIGADLLRDRDEGIGG